MPRQWQLRRLISHVRRRVALQLQQTVVRILHGRTVEVARVVHVRGGAAADAADADDRRLVGVNAQIVAERGRESVKTQKKARGMHAVVSL